MLRQVRPAVVMVLLLTLLTGIVYPLCVAMAARAFFPKQAAGSLLHRDGRVVGSELIGQRFRRTDYFHSRPSAAGAEGYDPTASGGSNLGPTNPRLIARVCAEAARLRSIAGGGRVPVDLVTTSGSGLDPHISPAAAEWQVPIVARARGLSEEAVRRAVAGASEQRQLGFLGEPRVNVLKLNLALDTLGPGQ